MALGLGLLIGAERERRKYERRAPSAAGIRTFALASAAGAVSYMLGAATLLAVATAAVAAFVALTRWRRLGEDPDDPGLTTEVALVLTVLCPITAIFCPVPSAPAEYKALMS